MWEKIYDARRKDWDEIEIEDSDGKKVRIRIDKLGWYPEHY